MQFAMKRNSTKGRSTRQSAWKALKYLLPTKNKASTSTSNLLQILSTPSLVQLVIKLQDISVILGSLTLIFHKLIFHNSFLFTPLDEHFVISHLLKLPNSTSLDQTNLDNYLLQLAANLIAPCLTYIFNLSLNNGCVPDSWKSASIIPIYTGKGDMSECGNYRPISIIPTVTKTIEYHVKVTSPSAQPISVWIH